MIQYNIKYDLNNGQGWISFEEASEGFVSAQYNRGTIQGHWDGDKLKGQFIDTVSNGKGLIEFSFNETGFEAKWKAGIEEGPMKGKWIGVVNKALNIAHDNLTGEQEAFIQEKSWWQKEEVPSDWFNSPAFILEIVKKDKDWLQLASNSIRKDKDIIKKIIKDQTRAIEFADESLLNDLEIAELCVQELPSTLRYFKELVREENNIILDAVKKDGWCLEFASENLKNNLEIVSLAIANTGAALQFASDELKKNREIVLKAVSQDGYALEHSHESLKSDREIAITAITKNFNAVSFIGDDLKENEELILEILNILSEDDYKEFFFLLPLKMRSKKTISNIISKRYKNANKWTDSSCDKSFLNYLAYFDIQKPWENTDNLSEFIEEYGINLLSSHFENLGTEFGILIFTVDNSDYAWEELGGNEKFTIVYDLLNNRILPKNMASPDEDDLGLIKKYQYLDSMHVGIYGPYQEVGAFNGCFSVCNYFEENNISENAFNIYFHGDELEEYSEGDTDIFQQIRTSITPEAMYKFVSDVLRKF